MIVPYFGEFLLTPIPLELSMNYCSHKCAYCFANLNNPERKATPKAMVSLLSDFQNRNTLVAQLLKEKYPILLSNKTDPFASSNWRLTLQILELLSALEIPVAFQTKGGKGLEEAMGLIKSSCFYVSLTCQDDAIAKKIEPGAPSMTERFRTIEMLREKGHHVWAGVNPLVKEWIPNLKGFVKRLKDAGIEYVWSEVLHLSWEQIKEMSEKEKEAIGSGILRTAQARNVPEAVMRHEMELIRECKNSGIQFGCKNWPEATDCLKPYRERYRRLFPSMTEFTTHACKTMKVGQEFSFTDWASFMKRDLPQFEKKTEFASYVYSCNRKLGKLTATSSGMDYDSILNIIWMYKEHRMCPSRSFAFKKVKIGTIDGEPIWKKGSDGFPVRSYTGKTLGRR